MVLWNRTDSQVRSDNLMVQRNEITVFRLTQMNNGYYNLRRNDNSLVSRKIVKVKGTEIKLDVFLYVIKNVIHFTLFHTANEGYQDAIEGERFFLKYPFTSKIWTLTFTLEEDDEEHTLIDNGIQVRGDIFYLPFKRRFSKYDDGIDIHPVERRDSGTFYFKDSDGNLAEIIKLEVLYGEQNKIRKKQRSGKYSNKLTCFL